MSTFDTDDVCERLDNIENNTGGICERLDRIESAVKSSKNWLSYGVGVFFVWALLAMVDDVIHSKWRYEIQCGVSSEHIHKSDRPHDCNFLHAPIGGKGCRYEITVTEEEVRKSQQPGRFVVSNDGGKTWAPTETATEYHDVWINWNKVDE
jgi:hypothetical protein